MQCTREQLIEGKTYTNIQLVKFLNVAGPLVCLIYQYVNEIYKLIINFLFPNTR